ncbi:uncharacterized protein [Apostichopus japonicus]|uniref:uncharacterized protein isoform X2 n=1 Tax=Stichopus japonicus TaxID=307972 RepID=UPI003AB2221B
MANWTTIIGFLVCATTAFTHPLCASRQSLLTTSYLNTLMKISRDHYGSIPDLSPNVDLTLFCTWTNEPVQNNTFPSLEDALDYLYKWVVKCHNNEKQVINELWSKYGNTTAVFQNATMDCDRDNATSRTEFSSCLQSLMGDLILNCEVDTSGLCID